MFWLTNTDVTNYTDVLQHVDLKEDGSVVTNIVVSSSYQLVALLTDRGRLWLGSSDLQNLYRLVDVRHFLIKQLAWSVYVLNCM